MADRATNDNDDDYTAYAQSHNHLVSVDDRQQLYDMDRDDLCAGNVQRARSDVVSYEEIDCKCHTIHGRGGQWCCFCEKRDQGHADVGEHCHVSDRRLGRRTLMQLHVDTRQATPVPSRGGRHVLCNEGTPDLNT